MKITLKEAYKLVDQNAPTKYRGTALIILKALLKKTYNPKIDDPQRQIRDKGVNPLMRAAGVSERQFERILHQLSDVLQYERHGGKIDYRLNLEPIASLEPDDAAKRKDREHRTQKARERRATNREQRDNAIVTAIAVARFILSPPETTTAA